MLFPVKACFACFGDTNKLVRFALLNGQYNVIDLLPGFFYKQPVRSKLKM